MILNRNNSFNFFVSVFIICLFASCEKSETNTPIANDEYIISSPQPNDTVFTGIHFEIEWDAPTFTHVDIELYKGSDLVYTIEENIEVRSGYRWMPLEDLPEGSGYYIKVSNSDNKSQSAINKESFIIKKYIKEFSEFTDPLDGHVYKTTKIGDQWWMSKNYTYDSEEGSYWMHNNKQQYEHFGKLYTYKTALNCTPPGWHLPTVSEWEELIANSGKSALAALTEGGGAGFNLSPQGFYTSTWDDGFFAHIMYETRYFTSSTDGGTPIILNISFKKNEFSFYRGGSGAATNDGFYVRYIKDKD